MPKLMCDRTVCFNYTLEVVNVFKTFCCETPGLNCSSAVSPDFSF